MSWNEVSSIWQPVLWGGICLLLAACGDSVVADTERPDLGKALEPLVAPELRLLAPRAWQAGATVTALGSGFAEPSDGQTELHVVGTFTETATEISHPVDFSVPTTFRNPGRVEWIFEPALPPAGFGHELGEFKGAVSARTIRDSQSSPYSSSVALHAVVEPSLVIWRAGPEARACDEPTVQQTIDAVVLEVDVEALGLSPASQASPLKFRAAWVHTDGEPREVSKTVDRGRTARLLLEPGALPVGELEGALNAVIEVVDGDGSRLERSLGIATHRELSVEYDGNVQIRELFHPVQVSSCLPGGEFGRDYSYNGGQSESRSRSFSRSTNVSLDLWLIDAGFNMGVTESVSSSQSESLSVSGRVLPGEFGVFYRQTQRLERIGEIIRRDACGAEYRIGQVRVTDWNWAPDLALTRTGTCPPAPPSNLPAAQVFE